MANNDKLSADYKNPNGCMTYAKLWDLHKGTDEERLEFHKKYRVTKEPCPPSKLRPKGIVCFHCKECFEYAIDNVKQKDVKKELEG